MNQEFLNKKLQERIDQNAYRQLRLPGNKADFCSNDYLGIVKNNLLQQSGELTPAQSLKYGSTGSRLLSGNYSLIQETEKIIADFHDAGAALIFNSGYDANVGLLSCVTQRGDTILYDYLVHASIRDGIRLSFAQSISFRHNDMEDLHAKLQKATGNIFVVTESVFSMDGDMAPLTQMAELCEQYNAHLIIDEAHSTGITGEKGEGLVQVSGITENCFARIHTFGKALGCHGAVILGSELLRNYLVNFCRPFIYTTSLPEISIAAIKTAYGIFPDLKAERTHLQQLVNQFQTAVLKYEKLVSKTPVQAVLIPGNEAVKAIAQVLQDNNLDVRPILYPTVPKGGERLRIVLHAFNRTDEVVKLIRLLS